MANNCSSKICKNRRKDINLELIFSKVVNQKSEAVTNMERFLNIFLGILQNLLKLSKKIILIRSCFWSKYLDLNYYFHCQNLTNYGWNQCHFHYQNQCPIITHFLFFLQQQLSVVSVCHCLTMTVVFWVWALWCALGLPRLLIYWGNWLQSYDRGMAVPVSSSRFQPYKHGSHFCISLLIC